MIRRQIVIAFKHDQKVDSMAGRSSAGRTARASRRQAHRRTVVRKPTPLEEEFESQVDYIRQGFFDRKFAGNPPFDTSSGFLKRECYQLVRSYRSLAGGYRVIMGVASRLLDKPIEKVSWADNPFYWGLAAILPDRGDLSAQDLSKFAAQLLYADRNDVEAKYLIGFLYQTGGPRDLKKKLENRRPDKSLAMRPIGVPLKTRQSG